MRNSRKIIIRDIAKVSKSDAGYAHQMPKILSMPNRSKICGNMKNNGIRIMPSLDMDKKTEILARPMDIKKVEAFI